MIKTIIINDNYQHDEDDDFIPFPKTFAYCVTNLTSNKIKKTKSKSKDVKSSYSTCGGYTIHTK